MIIYRLSLTTDTDTDECPCILIIVHLTRMYVYMILIYVYLYIPRCVSGFLSIYLYIIIIYILYIIVIYTIIYLVYVSSSQDGSLKRSRVFVPHLLAGRTCASLHASMHCRHL